MSREAALSFVTSGLAHDVNNPLMVILMQIQSITSGKNSKEIPEAVLQKLEAVKKNTIRIQEMMKSYLGLLGRVNEVEASTFEAAALLNGAIELCTPRLSRSSIGQIKVEQDSDFQLKGNQTQIELVFANLLNNALDAIRGQELAWIKIKVSEENQQIAFRVINSGTLSEDLRIRLFKEGLTTKGSEGHGIGLRITRSLAEANHGKLVIEPSEGHVCFKVTLPNVSNAPNFRYG